MDNVRCSGSEVSLFDCRHDGPGAHKCDGHYYDVGINCSGKQRVREYIAIPIPRIPTPPLPSAFTL